MLAKYIREAHADYRRIRRRVPLGPLRTEAEYHRAVAMLDKIIDEIGEQETHPLADLVETLALAISAYEEVHVPIPVSSGLEILRALMEDHGLSQSDLPEVGSQGVVSEVLSGKRDLNVRQIARLAARFGVSPAVFLQMPTPANQPSRRKQVLVGKK
ncbi:MAG: helix-turn-helix domain-containing protein [Nitrospira sp.]|nr:helix-turn-helix domain-containing protein [Nitrospira sp.]